jgi:Fic family protein
VQRAQYTEYSPGRLVPVGEGRIAFVPDPLPNDLQLDREATDALAKAEYALGRLAGETATLDDRLSVLAPLQHREALLSSRIDRIVTTPEHLVLTEAGAPAVSDEEQAHARSVLRYVRILKHGLASRLPISVRLISELHAMLVTDEASRSARPDEAPQHSEKSSEAPNQPRVVRLPVRDMQICLDAFEKRLRARPDQMPALVELALIHYQFEAIHPFRHGNGRIGRMILALSLSRQSRLPQPVLYLSAHLERHREEYFDLLRSVSQRSAWLPWITFFLHGVEESATECLEQVGSLLELHEHYHALFRGSELYASLEPLIDGLFELPCVSVARAAASVPINEREASMAIEALVSRGLLFGMNGPGKDRMFLAPAILGYMRQREDQTPTSS